MSAPALALCAIMRDAAADLPAWLESVRGLVDDLVLLDTGSRDGSVDIAKSLGARVWQTEWRHDFAWARNEALRFATSRWILWLDADERIRRDEHGRIRSLLNDSRCGAYLVSVLNHRNDANAPQFSTGHRLFRNLPGVKFEGRIHEQVAPSIEKLGLTIRQAPITIDHYGYALSPSQMNAKLQRNIDLLRMQVEADPRDSYARHQMAQSFMQLGRLAEAEQELALALRGRALPSDILASLHNNRADCRLRSGDPVGAILCSADSLRAAPRQIMANVLAYKAHRALGQFRDAMAHLADARQAAAHPAPAGSRPAVEAHFTPRQIEAAMNALREHEASQSHRDLDAAATARLRAGDLNGALDILSRLEAERPGDSRLKRVIAGVLVKLGRRDEAAACLASAPAQFT